MTRWHVAGLLSLGLHASVLAPLGLGAATRPALDVARGPTSLGVVVYLPTPAPALDRQDHRASPVARQSFQGAEGTGPRYHRNTPPRYPAEAYLKRIQGNVWVLAEIDPRGHPQRVVVERSSGSPLLDEAAVQAVRGWEFIPARRGAQPIASRCGIPVQFRIEEVS